MNWDSNSTQESGASEYFPLSFFSFFLIYLILLHGEREEFALLTVYINYLRYVATILGLHPPRSSRDEPTVRLVD